MRLINLKKPIAFTGKNMIHKLKKPKKLKPGDKIAAVNLSWGGPGTFPYRYEIGKKQLEDEFEVKIIEMPHTMSDAEWLKNNPKARADDLMQAFFDPDIAGIISTIGGDDSIRILPYIDFDVIKGNPKVFMGYSDTTITHFACLSAGLISFYGPSIMAGFAENGGMFPYMVNAIKQTVFSSDPIGQIKENPSGWTVEHLDWAEKKNQTRKRTLNPPTGWKFLQGSGIHQGHLIGGCIEVLDWLRGTDVWPSLDIWHGAVLFLETSEEAPTPVAVARILRTLAAIGVLKELKGILLGRPGGQIPIDAFSKYDEAVLQVVAVEEGLTKIPIVSRMDFGHTDPMTVIPYGVNCEIDCGANRISITENAVIE